MLRSPAGRCPGRPFIKLDLRGVCPFAGTLFGNPFALAGLSGSIDSVTFHTSYPCPEWSHAVGFDVDEDHMERWERQSDPDRSAEMTRFEPACVDQSKYYAAPAAHNDV